MTLYARSLWALLLVAYAELRHPRVSTNEDTGPTYEWDDLIACPGCSRTMPTSDLCECEDDTYGPLCSQCCHVGHWGDAS